jgi:hypothetical protein
MRGAIPPLTQYVFTVWCLVKHRNNFTSYLLPNTNREIISRKWAGRVALMGEIINSYRILVGKPEVKRPLGRPSRKYEYNIKMGLKWDMTVWTRFICLRIWTNGRLL